MEGYINDKLSLCKKRVIFEWNLNFYETIICFIVE